MGGNLFLLAHFISFFRKRLSLSLERGKGDKRKRERLRNTLFIEQEITCV
jgi:hypothetical protein